MRHRLNLSIPTNFNFIEFPLHGMEIGEARTLAAYRCLEHKPRPEYLFFLDYDVLPSHDALTKLYYRAVTNPDIDVVAGVYCCKWKAPCDPLIYTENGIGPFWDWTVGDLLTTEKHGIRATHMGLTLIKVSLFQRMLDAGVVTEQIPFFKTTDNTVSYSKNAIKRASGTEDIYFYNLAREVDCKIMVDTSVLAGHIDKNNGVTYGLPEDSPPIRRAHWLRSGKEGPEPIDKKAIDLGAGDTKRTWEGHVTYTTDIRPGTGVDYVQDTRWLNLPSEEFDLVASSHHLEHIPRTEQEQVWKEMFRICKPGGKIEHIVPSLEWAATKIVDNEVDGSVYNVLYGAQEMMGYDRLFNLHYFGYTKQIAKELAESVGFTNIQLLDWRDNDGLGYNLIIRGTKPEPVIEYVQGELDFGDPDEPERVLQQSGGKRGHGEDANQCSGDEKGSKDSIPLAERFRACGSHEVGK